MSKKFLSIILVTAILVVGIVVWRIQVTKANAAEKIERLESEIVKGLSEEEIGLVLKSQSAFDPAKTGSIIGTPESRKNFLHGMREYLSLAARARREGFTDEKNFATNLRLKENGLLMELYQNHLGETKKEIKKVSPEEIEALLANPENEKRFNEEIDAIYAVQNSAAELMESPLIVTPKLQGEGLEKSRKGWAKAKIVSDLARSDAEFMQLPIVRLRYKILEAGVLSTNLLAKHWKTRIKATSEEIEKFLAAHPEYDVSKKREKAQMVLERAKKGESFEKLAKEFSEDRSTKDKGGLYEDWTRGSGLWFQVEDAALAVADGQLVPQVIETEAGFHVVQLVKKRSVKDENGKESYKFSLRNILLQKTFADPSANPTAMNIPPPFKTRELIAKDEVEKEKRKNFIDEIIAAENISLPEDFHVEIAE